MVDEEVGVFHFRRQPKTAFREVMKSHTLSVAYAIIFYEQHVCSSYIPALFWPTCSFACVFLTPFSRVDWEQEEQRKVGMETEMANTPEVIGI